MDTVSPSERSRIMASVKSSGNKTTEALLVATLRKERLSGWRRHYSLVGKPDFVFPAQRLAVFVDGCFWHGCPKHCRIPNSNRKYWKKKIDRNVQRDREVNRVLQRNEWRVIRLWEHDLRGGQGSARKIKRMREIVQPDKCSVRGIPNPGKSTRGLTKD
jgi:DNA mismatch endonuclease (patch repair protein)